ncbi:MAG: pilus assembly protein [Alphaproteobacteria bacterium]|nr:pilus assembly protein [Alphaproteobacteria bacterium]
MRPNCQFLKQSKGNVAIEFAIVLPFLFLLLSGIMNFGLILANKNQLNGVVNAGMLFAFGNSSVPAAVELAMTTSTTNLSPLTVKAITFCVCSGGAPASCTATCPGGLPLSKYVTVTAQSQVNLVALDFILTNPFVTNAQGTIRTLR